MFSVFNKTACIVVTPPEGRGGQTLRFPIRRILACELKFQSGDSAALELELQLFLSPKSTLGRKKSLWVS
jgi:hypothetical protein